MSEKWTHFVDRPAGEHHETAVLEPEDVIKIDADLGGDGNIDCILLTDNTTSGLKAIEGECCETDREDIPQLTALLEELKDKPIEFDCGDPIHVTGKFIGIVDDRGVLPGVMLSENFSLFAKMQLPDGNFALVPLDTINLNSVLS